MNNTSKFSSRGINNDNNTPGLSHDWYSHELNQFESTKQTSSFFTTPPSQSTQSSHHLSVPNKSSLTFPLTPSFFSVSQALQPYSYLRSFDPFPLPIAYIQQPQSTAQQFKAKSRLRGSISTSLLQSTPSIGTSSGSLVGKTPTSVNKIKYN
jgi:hypothetical protein